MKSLINFELYQKQKKHLDCLDPFDSSTFYWKKKTFISFMQKISIFLMQTSKISFLFCFLFTSNKDKNTSKP